MSSGALELWNNQLLILENGSKTFYTQVIDADDLAIQYPVNKNNQRMSLLSADEPVSVYFYKDHGEMYAFRSKLVFTNNKVSLTKPDTIKKVQRREFFRVPAALDISVETECGNRLNYTTIDMSGGGVLLSCPNAEDFNIGDQVTGYLYLKKQTEKKEIPFTAKISRKELTHEPPRIALVFSEIQEAHRRAIIQYCQKIQLNQRNEFRKRIV